jgi:hypothetical protein
MQLRVNPMIVAAAFGLLGPAALADDDREEEGVAGLWSRVRAESPAARPAPLGEQIELIPVEDRVLLDDGLRLSERSESWLDLAGERLVQELHLDEARVTRRFDIDGDALTVHTVVDGTEGRFEYWDSYQRLG